jgi:hypothetical protein
MTWVTLGLFVGLTAAVTVLVRDDIRKAVRRRELRNRRRAEIHRVTVALQGMSAGFAAMAPAFERAAVSLQKFGDAMKASAASRTSPFPPSRAQKGQVR